MDWNVYLVKAKTCVTLVPELNNLIDEQRW